MELGVLLLFPNNFFDKTIESVSFHESGIVLANMDTFYKWIVPMDNAVNILTSSSSPLQKYHILQNYQGRCWTAVTCSVLNI